MLFILWQNMILPKNATDLVPRIGFFYNYIVGGKRIFDTSIANAYVGLIVLGNFNTTLFPRKSVFFYETYTIKTRMSSPRSKATWGSRTLINPLKELIL